jgi:hypothetical protein
VLTLIVDSPVGCLQVVFSTIVPIACIWFPEIMAGYTGYAITRGIAVTQPSHPGCVSLCGSLLLLLPVIQIIIIATGMLQMGQAI